MAQSPNFHPKENSNMSYDNSTNYDFTDYSVQEPVHQLPMLPSAFEVISFSDIFSGSGGGTTIDGSIPNGGKKVNKAKPRTPLPLEFQPTPYSVIFGHGKKCTEACGNRRLRVIISMHADRYSQAGNNKKRKSEIVSEVYSMIQDACPDKRAAFIRFIDGYWWEVLGFLAREKIAGMFRNYLHTKYRSSNKAKVQQRRERQQSLDSENRRVVSLQLVKIS
jgi:hypothetical protein